MKDLSLAAGIGLQGTKFKTSQRVTIIGAGGAPDIRNAVVRSYNQSTGEYYLTYRDENQMIHQILVAEERLQG